LPQAHRQITPCLARAFSRDGHPGALWVSLDDPARDLVQAFRKSPKIIRADIL
jgi:hypothetical protein